MRSGTPRGLLRAAATDGGAAPADPVAARIAELCEILAEVSEGKLPASEIDPSGHLFDYGYLDSLSAVTFIAMVEERYDVTIEDDEFVERLHTVDAFARHLTGTA